ncbi:MAG: hypothetical protein ABWY63_04135, partial [Hyphomicrobiaceae bacterium]
RCRGDAASNPGGQKRGDELSRTTRGVLSRDVGFRPPAGGLRKGRPREHIDIVNGLAIAPADKEMILWRNAARFFNLSGAA